MLIPQLLQFIHIIFFLSNMSVRRFIDTQYTVQIANELTIFAGLVRDSCESNACENNAYSFANTRTFREVLHMNQSETRGPRTG